jgi:protein SCO1/2
MRPVDPLAVAGRCACTTALVLALVFASLTCRAEAIAANDAPPSAPLPPGIAGVGIDEHLGAALPLDLDFRDHTGNDARLGSYFDHHRPVIVVLMYHRCPMLCSLVLDGLARALRRLDWTVGKEFDVVAISVDPTDGPAVASRKREQVVASYGRSEKGRGWHFLTGTEGAIRALANTLGFRYRWDPEQQQFSHPAAVFLLTPDAKIARYLYGVAFDPTDLRMGLLEASEGRSISTIDRALLYCFHYDATGRRYAFVVGSVIRGGGVLLVAVIGFALFRLFRAERARRS